MKNKKSPDQNIVQLSLEAFSLEKVLMQISQGSLEEERSTLGRRLFGSWCHFSEGSKGGQKGKTQKSSAVGSPSL